MPEGLEVSQLSVQEATLLARLRELAPARGAGAPPPLSFADRFAERVAGLVGSWRFIILQTLFFSAWIVLNVVGWIAAWDPYPFILFNLLLSLQAAYTAPIIMMSQTRQAQIDRYQVLSDSQVNLQAALELKLLHQKVDVISGQEIPDLRRSLARIESRLQRIGWDACQAAPPEKIPGG